MFEVGRSYRITIVEGDQHSSSPYTVEEVQLPLLRLSQPGRTLILNTSAPCFLSAELDDPETAWKGPDEASDEQDMTASSVPEESW